MTSDLFHDELLLQADQLVILAVDEQSRHHQRFVEVLVPVQPVLTVHCVLQHVGRHVKCLLFGDVCLSVAMKGISKMKDKIRGLFSFIF